MGTVLPGPAGETGLPAGTAVAIAGHDHVCAAFACGIVGPGRVLDSLGTAESFVGALAERRLGDQEFASGLTFGPHVVPGMYGWMGAQAASGGSLEWLRAVLGDEPLPYEGLAQLLTAAGPEPTPLLFFPYLLGSQLPLPGLSAERGGPGRLRGTYGGARPR